MDFSDVTYHCGPVSCRCLPTAQRWCFFSASQLEPLDTSFLFSPGGLQNSSACRDGNTNKIQLHVLFLKINLKVLLTLQKTVNFYSTELTIESETGITGEKLFVIV